MSWTEEKVNKLKELWGKSNTASQIAEIIGGVSRNAVIGKAHRLNLSSKIKARSSIQNQKSLDKNQNTSIKLKGKRGRLKTLLLDKNFEPENPKTLEQLDNDNCRWPIGHPDEENFYFCGRKPIEGFAYCKLHVLYAFQPKNPKEELINKEDDVPAFIEKKVKASK